MFFCCIYPPHLQSRSLNGFKWLGTPFKEPFDYHGTQRMCVKGGGLKLCGEKTIQKTNKAGIKNA